MDVKLDILDVKILKCVFRGKDWNRSLWYVNQLEDITGVGYHTLRNHLIKLCKGGYLKKSKTTFPAYYEAVDDEGVRLKVEVIFKKWVEVLLEDERV